MYRYCRHCKHTGSFIHEEGHSCQLHNFSVSLNNLDAIHKMYECQDCEISLDEIHNIARYASNISVQSDFDDYFESMNNMGTYIKAGMGEKWQHHQYDSLLEVLDVRDVKNDHVLGYKILFDGFPVYKTTNIEEIDFIMKGLGMHKASISTRKSIKELLGEEGYNELQK